MLLRDGRTRAVPGAVRFVAAPNFFVYLDVEAVEGRPVGIRITQSGVFDKKRGAGTGATTRKKTNMLSEQERTWAENRLAAIRAWERSTDYEDFIQAARIDETLRSARDPQPEETQDVIAKARGNATSGALLSPRDVAVLANTTDPELWEAIFETADWIKRTVYGNRIVLFAPLYLSSPCVNNCVYCGFRHSNDSIETKTLSPDEVNREGKVLVDTGHKRLIVVYGEHPQSDVSYMCRTIEALYGIHEHHGEIRRVNVNAAPLFVEEFKEIHEVGIGTYQVFQETYHRNAYARMHPRETLKGEYAWRLFALHRALEAGVDDVALGVLLGLYDWRYELLGLLHHAMSLEKHFGIGPHTISYPRMFPAINTPFASNSPYLVSDEEFVRAVAVIRLMCPYTGSILTARERPELRREVIRKGGVSQMDAGSRIAVGGYARMADEHIPEKEQFQLNDTRGLDAFVRDLCDEGYLPSFCTAGYREGRTGANFMPLAKNASVNKFCIANGILTFKEYLLDYASPETREIGDNTVIPRYLDWLERHDPRLSSRVKSNLRREEADQRDLHF